VGVLIQILFWISTGMLIPVIILLLAAFMWALLLLGDLYGVYAARLKRSQDLERLIRDVTTTRINYITLEEYIKNSSKLGKHIYQLRDCNWHPVHGEKILADFDLLSLKEVEGATSLMRLGPMLGLMGTLIPMGPALVGLAAGDIASMALNMQVAFSTTVIGIFIGAVGFLVQLVKRRWLNSDHANLRYLYDLSQEEMTHEKNS